MNPRPATHSSLLCLLLAVCAPVQAQGASAAEAEAAMARAQRQAGNPMRVILEAGKPRVRLREIDIAPAAGVPAPQPAEATLVSLALQARAPATREPPLAGSEAVPLLQQRIPPLLALARPLETPPLLVSRVDPEISPRVQQEIGPLPEVWAELTVRADGTVAAVALVSPVPRALQRPVLAALEQWRYDPLPAQRKLRVQLVFGSER